MKATRTATTLAGLVLAIGALGACGDGDDGGGSGQATDKEFCDGFRGLITDAAGVSKDDIPAQIVSVKEQVADLEEGGTPESMPEDAERGFATFADAVSGIDEDATLEDLQSLGDGFGEAEEKDGQAFLSWVEEECLGGQ